MRSKRAAKKAGKKKTPVIQRQAATTVKTGSSEVAVQKLLGDIRPLIEQTRDQIAQALNSGLVLLNWRIGSMIRREILGVERAQYGQHVVQKLADHLTAEYGIGFTKANLFHMIRFAEAFTDEQIVYTLCRQLSWSHFRQIIYLNDPVQRDFYTEMCRIERWSVRALRDRIRGMLYERTALSKNTEEFITRELAALREEDRMTPDLVFRDPYLLDFLELSVDYSEQELESAILRDLEKVLLELGSDFAFVARQKRMPVDGKDYYLDLLFYHRGLVRLIGIELKIGAFEPTDVGQALFYLRWLDKYERKPHEGTPLMLILCSEKGESQVELLELDPRVGVRVAQYLTAMPPRPVLEAKLNQVIKRARERFGRATLDVVAPEKAKKSRRIKK